MRYLRWHTGTHSIDRCVVCTQDVCISSLFHFIFHVPRCVVLLAHSATLVHSLSQADCAHRMILHNFDLSYVIKHMVRKQMSCFRCHNHRAACFQWIRSFLCVCEWVFRWSLLYRSSKNSLLNHYRFVFIRIKDEYHLRHDGSLLFSEDAIQH